MSKTRMRYFEQDDVLHLVISDEPEAGSVELGPNITAELNDKGELIGIEILEASRNCLPQRFIAPLDLPLCGETAGKLLSQRRDAEAQRTRKKALRLGVEK